MLVCQYIGPLVEGSHDSLDMLALQIDEAINELDNFSTFLPLLKDTSDLIELCA